MVSIVIYVYLLVVLRVCSFFFFVFLLCLCCCFFFFFSSRRRHTRWTGDWSSDVCSSDLAGGAARPARPAARVLADDPRGEDHRGHLPGTAHARRRRRHDRGRRQLELPRLAAPPRRSAAARRQLRRSEERRVGKECRLPG